MSVGVASQPPRGMEMLAALDAALPDLASSFDLTSVARRFEGQGRGLVARCSLHSARYEPGVRCVTSYELDFDDGDARRSTIGVIELTTRGAGLRDYTEDPALPGLQAAAALASAEWLGVARETAGAVVASPVRYHPGERCVLRYEVRVGGGETIVRYGKVVASDAATFVQTLRALHGACASRSAPGGPRVPAVVGAIGELGLVVQERLVGDPLHRVVFDHNIPTTSRLSAWRSSARAVAGLHALQVPAPSVVTRADDVAELWAYLPAVRAVDDGLATRLAQAIERADAAAHAAVPPDQLAPSHGSLRTDHVVLCPDGPGLIDLDGWCAAEPARDIGNLFAYLRWRAIRQPEHGELMAQVRHVVMEEYRQAGGALDDADVGFFEAVSLLRIAGRRYRSLTVGEWPLTPALIDAATDMLLCGGRA